MVILKFKKIIFTPIKILEDIHVKKVLVSNMISSGEKNYKYFICYLYNDHNVKPLHIMLPKRSTYIKRFDGQSKWIIYHHLVENDDILEKYTIWDKVSANIRKGFDSEAVYNKEFLKTKIKFHGDEVTDFYDKKVHKVNSNHTCLAVISLDSAFNKDGNWYPQVFLKECKYFEKKVNNHIIDDLESSSDDCNNSDEE